MVSGSWIGDGDLIHNPLSPIHDPQAMLKNLKDKYTVIVVGGGVNGCGVLRDLALRGVDSLLVEKNDFSAGTSGASSGMIHGGARYLLSEVGVTKLSSLDSGYIQKIAPHLLFRIPFLLTVYDNKKHSGLAAKLYLQAAEAFLQAYDQFAKLKNAQKHTRLTAKEVLKLEPAINAKNLVGGLTFDEWGIDVPRLCWLNVLDAKEHGSFAVNHTKVTHVQIENNQINSVILKDVLTGEQKTVGCKMLINTSGPWSPVFANLVGANIKLRLTKGVHLVFDRRLTNVAIVSQAIDGREIFLLPYENTTILGTTDDDFFSDLDNQRVTQDEIGYLIDAIKPVFPSITKARMIYAYSGVRPTLYQRHCYEDDLSREHEVIDHQKTDSINNMVSVIGGKLASYRLMAKEATDLVCHKLGVDKKSSTHEKYLPGGQNIPEALPLAKDYGVEPFLVSRLIYRHGARAVDVLNLIKKDSGLGAYICTCEPVCLAEVYYVIKNEMVRTMADLRRRTRLGMGPCQGTNCLIAATNQLLKFLNKDQSEFSSFFKKYMLEFDDNRKIVLEKDQVLQEKLLNYVLYDNSSLDLD